MPKVLPSEGTTLPANYTTVGLHGCIDRSSIAFSVERDGTRMPVDFDEERPRVDWLFMGRTVQTTLNWTKLSVRAQLTAGDTLILRYTTEHDEDAGLQEVEVRWPVGEEEQLPALLGTLDVRTDHGVISVSANASCSRDMHSSYADVDLQASEEARVWLKRIRYELRIDDVPWLFYYALEDQHYTGTWHSALGPGEDRIVLGCEIDPHRPVIHDAYLMPQALEPGPHRVRMVGFLASGEEMSSEEVIVDMQCDPDSARALKAELDTLKASRVDAQSSTPAAVSGDGCSVTAPGSTHSSGWPTLVIVGWCLMGLGRAARPCSRPRRSPRLTLASRWKA